MNVFDLSAVLRLDSSDFERGLGAAKKAASTGMKIVGAAVAASGGALLAFGKAAIDTGKAFDSSMSQVAATLGYTSDEIADSTSDASKNFSMLREAALKMGSETMYTAEQSAEGLNILAMAGYDAQDAVDILPNVLHLAAAGSMELSEAASYVSGSLKGFAGEGKDSAFYADLIAKGATLANTSVSQLGSALSAASATASSYGQSSDSVTLSLLRLANQNVTGTAATTALNRAMADLYTPTAEAEKALKSLGVNAYDPTTHKARDFNDIVNDLDTALAGMTDEEKNAYKATIFTAQGMNAFNKMTAASTEDIAKWKDGISDATGSAEEQYATMTDNLEGDITTLGSAMDGLKIAVSDELTPSFREFVQFASGGVSQITEGFRNGGLSGAVTAFSGVLSEGVSMILKKAPEFVGASIQLAGAIAKGIIDSAPTVISGFSQMLISGLAHINASAPEFIASGAEMIASFIGGFADTLPSWMGRITTVAVTIVTALVKNAPLVLSAGVKLIKSFVRGIIDNIPVVVQAVSDMVLDMGEGIAEGMPEFISNALTMVQEFATTIAENAPTLISAGMELLLNVAQGIADSIPALVSQVPQIITTFANVINDNAPQVLMTGVGIILTLVQGLIQAIPDIIAAIPSIIEAVVSVWTAFNWINLGRNVVTFIKNGIKNLPSTVRGIIKNAVNNIKSTFTGGGIESVVTNIFTKVKSFIETPIRNAISTVKSVVATVTNPFQTTFEKAFSIVKSAIDKIKGVFNFSWSLPSLKLPHFSVSGNFSLNPPSIPTFGISWYKKAMDNAMVLNSPTLFGMAGGNLLGAGEAGREVIAGEGHLMDMIQNASGGPEQNKLLAELINVNMQMLDAMRKKKKVVIGGRDFGRAVGVYG